MKKSFDYIGILLGSLIMSTSIAGFIARSVVIPGGVTGFANILYKLYKFPIGVTLFIVSSIIFFAGFKLLGKEMLLKTLVCFVSYSVFTNLSMHFVPPFTSNNLVAAIAGGGVFGFGLGVVIRCGGSMGATDLVAKIINNYKQIPIGVSVMVMDTTPLVIGAILFGAPSFLYSVLGVAVMSIMLQILSLGTKR